MIGYVFLATILIFAGAILGFIFLSSNPAAKFLKKKLFQKKVNMKKKLGAVVMSGPSGVGKGTLIAMLMKEFPTTFGFSVSHTTRAPRPGEADGVNYHFTTVEKFEQMIKNDEFVEYAKVHNNYYGTSKKALAAVSEGGKVAIVEIDVKGAKKFKETMKGTSLSVIYLFFKAPSIEELRARILGRGKETPEQIDERLKTAAQELEFVKVNESLYDRVIENNKLEDTYDRLKRTLKFFGGL